LNISQSPDSPYYQEVGMMANKNNQISGFNDLKQVELSIDAAQKMVGSATMSMDPDLLEGATHAVNDARSQLTDAVSNATGVDNEFLKQAEQLLQQSEEQLNEAKH
jgi:hypothetical protein